MNHELGARVGAETREVRNGERDGQPTVSVVAQRSYATTVEDVWDAITREERLRRWFLPITGELRLGGRYQLEGNAGGVIERCEPPRYLAVTWEYGGGTSWVMVQLSEDGAGGTLLELQHEAPIDPHWEQFGPGAAGVGWDMALKGLDEHLSSGEAVDPEAAMAWMTSPEGKSFIRRSSDAWGDAAIAFGEDEASARAAAERTAGFYTGEAADAPAD